MEQLTREQAIRMAEQEGWKELSEIERFEFQMNQDRLCMPFGEFHRCSEVAMRRPIWTHEFANKGELWREYQNGDVIGLVGVLEKLARYMNGPANQQGEK